ncbi:MAG TPA: hypothetical protein VJ837_02930 [Candidatus Paceibacterota bacterium]|nr:hypothetical protein [Candidatus Paceibacterota bacterium]
MVEHIVHEHGDSSSSTALIAVIVVLLVLIVGWFAYNAGVFGARQDDGPDVIDVNLGGGGGTPDGGTGNGGVTY